MGAKSVELSKGYNLVSKQEEALFASLKKTIFFFPIFDSYAESLLHTLNLALIAINSSILVKI